MKQKQKKKQIQKKKKERVSIVEYVIILAMIAMLLTILVPGIQNAYDKRIYQREFSDITHEKATDQAWKKRKIVNKGTYQINEQTKTSQYRVTFQHETIVKMEEKMGTGYEVIFQKK